MLSFTYSIATTSHNNTEQQENTISSESKITHTDLPSSNYQHMPALINDLVKNTKEFSQEQQKIWVALLWLLESGSAISQRVDLSLLTSAINNRDIHQAQQLLLQIQGQQKYPVLIELLKTISSSILLEILVEIANDYLNLKEDEVTQIEQVRIIINPENSLELRIDSAKRLIFATHKREIAEWWIHILELIQGLIESVQHFNSEHGLVAIKGIVSQLREKLDKQASTTETITAWQNSVTIALVVIEELLGIVERYRQLPEQAGVLEYFQLILGTKYVQELTSDVENTIQQGLSLLENNHQIYQQAYKIIKSDENIEEKTNRLNNLIEDAVMQSVLNKGQANNLITFLSIGLDILQTTHQIGHKPFKINDIRTILSKFEQWSKTAEIESWLGKQATQSSQLRIHQAQLGIAIVESLSELEVGSNYNQYLDKIFNDPHLEELLPENVIPLISFLQTLWRLWNANQQNYQTVLAEDYPIVAAYFEQYPQNGSIKEQLKWLTDGLTKREVTGFISLYLPTGLSQALQQFVKLQNLTEEFPIRGSFLEQTQWALKQLPTNSLKDFTKTIGQDQTWLSEDSLNWLYTIVCTVQESGNSNFLVQQILNFVFSDFIKEKALDYWLPGYGTYINQALKIGHSYLHKGWQSAGEQLQRAVQQHPTVQGLNRIGPLIEALINGTWWQVADEVVQVASGLPEPYGALCRVYSALSLTWKVNSIWEIENIAEQEKQLSQLSQELSIRLGIEKDSAAGHALNLLTYLAPLRKAVNHYKQLPQAGSWLGWADQISEVLSSSQSMTLHSTYKEFNRLFSKWIANQIIQTQQSVSHWFSREKQPEVWWQSDLEDNWENESDEQQEGLLENLPWLEIGLGLTTVLTLLSGYKSWQAFDASSIVIEHENTNVSNNRITSLANQGGRWGRWLGGLVFSTLIAGNQANTNETWGLTEEDLAIEDLDQEWQIPLWAVVGAGSATALAALVAAWRGYQGSYHRVPLSDDIELQDFATPLTGAPPPPINTQTSRLRQWGAPIATLAFGGITSFLAFWKWSRTHIEKPFPESKDDDNPHSSYLSGVTNKYASFKQLIYIHQQKHIPIIFYNDVINYFTTTLKTHLAKIIELDTTEQNNLEQLIKKAPHKNTKNEVLLSQVLNKLSNSLKSKADEAIEQHNYRNYIIYGGAQNYYSQWLDGFKEIYPNLFSNESKGWDNIRSQWNKTVSQIKARWQSEKTSTQTSNTKQASSPQISSKTITKAEFGAFIKTLLELDPRLASNNNFKKEAQGYLLAKWGKTRVNDLPDKPINFLNYLKGIIQQLLEDTLEPFIDQDNFTDQEVLSSFSNYIYLLHALVVLSSTLDETGLDNILLTLNYKNKMVSFLSVALELINNEDLSVKVKDLTRNIYLTLLNAQDMTTSSWYNIYNLTPESIQDIHTLAQNLKKGVNNNVYLRLKMADEYFQIHSEIINEIEHVFEANPNSVQIKTIDFMTQYDLFLEEDRVNLELLSQGLSNQHTLQSAIKAQKDIYNAIKIGFSELKQRINNQDNTKQDTLVETQVKAYKKELIKEINPFLNSKNVTKEVNKFKQVVGEANTSEPTQFKVIQLINYFTTYLRTGPQTQQLNFTNLIRKIVYKAAYDATTSNDETISLPLFYFSLLEEINKGISEAAQAHLYSNIYILLKIKIRLENWRKILLKLLPNLEENIFYIELLQRIATIHQETASLFNALDAERRTPTHKNTPILSNYDVSWNTIFHGEGREALLDRLNLDSFDEEIVSQLLFYLIFASFDINNEALDKPEKLDLVKLYTTTDLLLIDHLSRLKAKGLKEPYSKFEKLEQEFYRVINEHVFKFFPTAKQQFEQLRQKQITQLSIQPFGIEPKNPDQQQILDQEIISRSFLERFLGSTPENYYGWDDESKYDLKALSERVKLLKHFQEFTSLGWTPLAPVDLYIKSKIDEYPELKDKNLTPDTDFTAITIKDGAEVLLGPATLRELVTRKYKNEVFKEYNNSDIVFKQEGALQDLLNDLKNTDIETILLKKYTDAQQNDEYKKYYEYYYQTLNKVAVNRFLDDLQKDRVNLSQSDKPKFKKLAEDYQAGKVKAKPIKIGRFTSLDVGAVLLSTEGEGKWASEIFFVPLEEGNYPDIQRKRGIIFTLRANDQIPYYVVDTGFTINRDATFIKEYIDEENKPAFQKFLQEHVRIDIGQRIPAEFYTPTIYDMHTHREEDPLVGTPIYTSQINIEEEAVENINKKLVEISLENILKISDFLIHTDDEKYWDAVNKWLDIAKNVALIIGLSVLLAAITLATLGIAAPTTISVGFVAVSALLYYGSLIAQNVIAEELDKDQYQQELVISIFSDMFLPFVLKAAAPAGKALLSRVTRLFKHLRSQSLSSSHELIPLITRTVDDLPIERIVTPTRVSAESITQPFKRLSALIEEEIKSQLLLENNTIESELDKLNSYLNNKGYKSQVRTIASWNSADSEANYRYTIIAQKEGEPNFVVEPNISSKTLAIEEEGNWLRKNQNNIQDRTLLSKYADGATAQEAKDKFADGLLGFNRDVRLLTSSDWYEDGIFRDFEVTWHEINDLRRFAGDGQPPGRRPFSFKKWWHNLRDRIRRRPPPPEPIDPGEGPSHRQDPSPHERVNPDTGNEAHLEDASLEEDISVSVEDSSEAEVRLEDSLDDALEEARSANKARLKLTNWKTNIDNFKVPLSEDIDEFRPIKSRQEFITEDKMKEVINEKKKQGFRIYEESNKSAFTAQETTKYAQAKRKFESSFFRASQKLEAFKDILETAETNKRIRSKLFSLFNKTFHLNGDKKTIIQVYKHYKQLIDLLISDANYQLDNSFKHVEYFYDKNSKAAAFVYPFDPLKRIFVNIDATLIKDDIRETVIHELSHLSPSSFDLFYVNTSVGDKTPLRAITNSLYYEYLHTAKGDLADSTAFLLGEDYPPSLRDQKSLLDPIKIAEARVRLFTLPRLRLNATLMTADPIAISIIKFSKYFADHPYLFDSIQKRSVNIAPTTNEPTPTQTPEIEQNTLSTPNIPDSLDDFDLETVHPADLSLSEEGEDFDILLDALKILALQQGAFNS